MHIITKMESHSSKMYSSSSSLDSHPKGEKEGNPCLSSLRRVRSLPSKPITKKPIAPSRPTPPKIYKVEATNFKEVVQMLTTTPEFQSHCSNSTSCSSLKRLQEVAPPPLDLSPSSLSRKNIAGQWEEFLPDSSSKNSVVISTDEGSNNSITEAQERDIGPKIPLDTTTFGASSGPLGFPMSPPFAWYSSLMSPGTLTSFGL